MGKLVGSCVFIFCFDEVLGLVKVTARDGFDGFKEIMSWWDIRKGCGRRDLDFSECCANFLGWEVVGLASDLPMVSQETDADVKKVVDARLQFIGKRAEYPTECLCGFGAVSVGDGHVERIEGRVIPTFADEWEGGDKDLGLSVAERFKGFISCLVGEFSVEEDGGDLAFLKGGEKVACVIDAFGEDEGASAGAMGLLDGINDQFVSGGIAAEGCDHRGEIVVVFVVKVGFDRMKGRDQQPSVFFEIAFLDLVDDIPKVRPKKFVHPVFSVGCGGEGDAKTCGKGGE